MQCYFPVSVFQRTVNNENHHAGDMLSCSCQICLKWNIFIFALDLCKDTSIKLAINKPCFIYDNCKIFGQSNSILSNVDSDMILIIKE